MLLLPSLSLAPDQSVHRLQMVVFQKKKRVGVAIFTTAPRGGGGRATSLDMTLSAGTLAEVMISEIESVDAAGRQVSSKLAYKSKLGTEVTRVHFSAQGAVSANLDRQGKNTSKSFPAPKSSRKDPSVFWFVTSRPSPGTWVSCTHFSPARLTWEPMKTTFVGRKAVSVGGRTVTANEIIQIVPGETDTYWLDDHGDPYVIDTGKTRFERKQ